MYRRLFLSCFTLCALAPAAWGGDSKNAGVVQATAAQITELLSGNTIVGTWSGTPYKQFYFENGRTVYVPEGGRPSEGKWRVKNDTDEDDSWWENTGWTPYKVRITIFLNSELSV